MAIVVTTQKVFVKITKGNQNLNSTILCKTTIRGPSNTPSNMEDRVTFATKTDNIQSSTFGYILHLPHAPVQD